MMVGYSVRKKGRSDAGFFLLIGTAVRITVSITAGRLPVETILTGVRRTA